MTEEERRRYAYHEAGHAVVGYSLGLRFDYITMEPTEDSRAHVQFSRLPDVFYAPLFLEDVRWMPTLRAYAKRVLEPQIVASLAGFAVDARFI